jgi:hypothetical protein
MRLWVDDERGAPDGWARVQSSEAAIAVIGAGGVTDLSLDHDLGGPLTTRDLVLWMAENDVWPARIYVHTANPVGRRWLVGMIDRYGPGVRSGVPGS